MNRICALVLLLLAAGSGGIRWFTDYDLALARAQKENKPLWLHFGENPG